MKDLPKKLRIKAGMITMGEHIAWGSDTSIMYQAATKIESMQEKSKRLTDLLTSVRDDMETYMESNYWPNIHVKIDEINKALITCI
jgi:hypothetical protein